MRHRSRHMLMLLGTAGGLVGATLPQAPAMADITTPSGTYRAGSATTTAGIQPEVAAGNTQSCSEFGTFALEFDVVDGGWFDTTETTITVGGGYVHVYDNDGIRFSWDSNVAIDLVVVKGTDAYDAYAYGTPALADTDLHAPQRYNPAQDRWQDVSVGHTLFCTNGSIDPPEALPPTVTNDVSGTYDAVYSWDVTKSASATEPVRQPVGTDASIDYEVAYTRTGPAYANGVVTGTATVSNPNADSITLGEITAELSDGTTCSVIDPPGTLAPGDNEIGYTCELTDLPPPIGLSHTVTVSWPDQTLPGGASLPAGTATYSDGGIPFTENDVDECADVSDSNTGTTVSGTICDSTTFDYGRAIPVEAGCFDFDNTADFVTTDTGTTDSSSVTVTVCGSQDLVVTKTATPTFTRTYAWTIEKSPDTTLQQTAGDADVTWTVDVTKDAGTDSEFVVAGTIEVDNPNYFDIAGIDVTDAVTDGDCAVTDGTDVTILATSTAQFAYECSFAANPGTGTNTATATWDSAEYDTANDSASGTADFEFGDPTTVVNDSIDVSDSNGKDWSFSSTGSVTYTTTYADPAGTCTQHANTAEIAQTGQYSEASTTVCVGANLTVAKTASTEFARTYEWDISKAAVPTLVKKIGGTASFGYTVIASQTGFTDSDWAVSGDITVTNPNDWQSVAVDLAESLAGCTLDQTAVTVPASDSVTVGYVCPLASATDGTNTVTAIWDADASSTPSGSASDDEAYGFGSPTSTTNSTMTFTDDFAAIVTQLGTLTATDVGPYAANTYTYSRTVNVPTWGCTTYGNTAQIVETGQKAAANVTVCGAAHTYALTMGFWQNKNGQAIITNFCAGTSGTSLKTFLTGYSPFANLTATSCRDIAAYVMNVIKAANASGASMNAMLKGQMLATALDVYFSAPLLGGNRIGAPAPVGAAVIDLTSVCKNIAGGCTVFEDTSSAFGGAASMTVSELLTTAAGQSNSGGSTWYGNVKLTQGLAKDTFDAINNQRAFSA